MSNNRILQNKNYVITQHYGNNGHTGADIVGEGHTADYVVAHSDGTIVMCQKGQKNNKGATGNASYGNFVKIRHANGFYTLYAHLDTVVVENNKKIKKGDVIGYMGNTGNSYGTHLHFEVFNRTTRINPEPYIAQDLPGNPTNKIDVIYQVNVEGNWLPNVINYNNIDYNGYAGIIGKPFTAIRMNATEGDLRYKVHVRNGSWLDLVTNRTKDANGDDFAGIIGKPIDAIMIQYSGERKLKYRVKTVHGWLPWVTGFSQSDSVNGYAGNIGENIDAIQIYIM